MRESFWWTYLGAFIGGAWMMLVGTVAAAAAPEARRGRRHGVRGRSGLSGPRQGAAWRRRCSGLVAVSTLNFYGASLTLLSVADTLQAAEEHRGQARREPRWSPILRARRLRSAPPSSFGSRFGDLLAVLLYLFTPWTAINLVDFYVVRKGHYSIREIFNPNGMYGRWNWRGLVAYFVGFLVMMPFFSTEAWTGPDRPRCSTAPTSPCSSACRWPPGCTCGPAARSISSRSRHGRRRRTWASSRRRRSSGLPERGAARRYALSSRFSGS